MHAAKFRATAELRKYLPGVEEALLVESAFEPLLLVQVALVEHRVHEVALLDADPVLAGQDSADLDAEPEDVGAERLRALEFAGLVGVVEDQRMQISVAGVKHVGDAQAVSRFHLPHAQEDVADALARNRSVHAI